MNRLLRTGLLLVTILGAGAASLAAPAASTPVPLPEGLAADPLSHCGLNNVQGANWDFCYSLDDVVAHGLRVTSVRYQGTHIFFDIGFPFSITKYHNNAYGPYKDILGVPSQNPGFGNGAMVISPTACPRFLGFGGLQAGGKVCVESATGPNPRVAVWSRFDIYNYRYIQGYIFHADGTLEPFVMLGGQLIDGSSCSAAGGSTCTPHHHYLYWRMDIDLVENMNDRVQEFRYLNQANTGQNNLNAPSCPSTLSSWCTIATESGRLRSLSQVTKWRVADVATLNAKGHPLSIELVSGSQAAADTVSTKDFWALRCCPSEVGYNVPASPLDDSGVTSYASNAESLTTNDVVVWYSEKVYHEPRDEETPSMMYHRAGPTLRVRNLLSSNNVEATYP